MLFFNRDNQDKILLGYFPKGLIFQKAHESGAEFNKVIRWIASGFQWLIDKYNETFMGIFICKSDFFIEQFKKDYNIPNEIFYQSTKEEHVADIKVIKYLMRGNMAWNFQAIASQYGICVKVESGKDYYFVSRLPAKIPYKLFDLSALLNVNNILVVTIYQDASSNLPYKLPMKLGTSLKENKLKAIYDKIKPAQSSIIYMRNTVNTPQCVEIDICKKES